MRECPLWTSQEATQGLQSFLDDVEEVVPVDDEVCWIFANGAATQAPGTALTTLTFLLALLRYVSVTAHNNRRHFERMGELDIISA